MSIANFASKSSSVRRVDPFPQAGQQHDRPQFLADALRDAARWLQSAGDTCNLQSLKDAATRAQATLAEVAHV